MKKPKFAVIGVRGYAGNYLHYMTELHEAGVIDFAAAVVRTPAKAAEQLEKLKPLGVEIYPDTASLYAARKDIDVMCIPTGIEFHEPMTIEALEHGCNVVVEKPVSATVDSVDRMIAAEKKHPELFVQVGFQHMADRNLWYLKELLLAGKLGKINTICIHGVWPRNDSYYNRNNWAAKIANAQGTLILDSPVNNAFAHYLNIALFMAGGKFAATAEPRSIQAELLRARPVEMFDSCAFKVRTVNDVNIVGFLCHSALNASEPQLRIECEQGTIHWQMGDANKGWRVEDENGKILASGITGRSNGDMFNDTVKKFYDRNFYVCTLAMSRNHTRCIEAMYRNFKPFDFPKELVKRREEDGQYSVTGLEDFGMKCFLSGELFLAPGMSELPPMVDC